MPEGVGYGSYAGFADGSRRPSFSGFADGFLAGCLFGFAMDSR